MPLTIGDILRHQMMTVPVHFLQHMEKDACMKWLAFGVAILFLTGVCILAVAQEHGYSEGGASVSAMDTPGAVAANKRLCTFLPQAGTDGWTLTGAPTLYVPGNLWEYIDGNADLFKSFGFQWLASGKYTRMATPDAFITVDIYDMNKPINAFGIYSAERAGNIQYLQIGVQGYRSQDLLIFWQGRYLVKIAAVNAGNNIAPAMTDLAQNVAKAIPDPATIPAMVQLLPTAGRISNTEKYNRRNFLGHGFLTNVVSAQYQISTKKVTGFIIDAGTPQAAKAQISKLQAFEKADGKAFAASKIAASSGFTVRDPYLGAMAVVLRGQYIVGAYGGSDIKVVTAVAVKLVASVGTRQ